MSQFEDIDDKEDFIGCTITDLGIRPSGDIILILDDREHGIDLENDHIPHVELSQVEDLDDKDGDTE